MEIYYWLQNRLYWQDAHDNRVRLIVQPHLRPCIDSNKTDTFKAQKRSKDIIKIVHVTSVVQP